MLRRHTCLAVLVLVSVVIAPSVSNGADPTIAGWWTFDDGTPTDISGNGLDGLLLGNAVIVADPERGQVLQINQNGMQVDGPFAITTSFTLSAWIKLDQPRTGRYYFGGPWWIRTDNQGGSEHHWCEIRYPDGSFVDKFDTRSGNSPEGQLDGQWHHIAVVLPEDGAVKAYVDGALAPVRDNNTKAHDFEGAVGPLFFGTQDENGGNAISGYMDDIRVFNYAISEDEIQAIMNGAGLAGVEFPLARRPVPEDGTMLEATWATLSWRAGDYAVSHDVYLGDNSDDVNGGTPDTAVFQGNQGETTILAGFPGFPFPEGLIPGATYYWRIDEVNDADPNSPWKGDVWSFSIQPYTAYSPDPADGAEFVDPDGTFNWTPGFGAALHTFYVGTDFEEVNNAIGGVPRSEATLKPGPLESEKVYYWRVDEFDGAATHKGDVWAFTTPGAAGDPMPANGAVDVTQTQVLSWTPAETAASHDLYFGADKDAVANATEASPEFKGNKPGGAASYDPGKMPWNTTHYWRVDAVYAAETIKGLVWSFATANFLLVDDFESYNDIDPPDPNSNTIYSSWIDGYGIPTNGALTANELPPYAEQTIVHGGAQSMKYLYDTNLMISESTLTLIYPKDWTAEGVTKLSLWFRGASGNAADRMFVALGDAVVYHDDASATQITGWNEWVIDLQAFAGLDLTNVNTMTIGFGTKNSPAAGGSGQMYFDDIRLYR
ncbi:MAG: hypothetical protein ISS70_12370 [Phycisphaerae bacterium]|nr:hypothetical protein [Phycisphaerae bacterium]